MTLTVNKSSAGLYDVGTNGWNFSGYEQGEGINGVDGWVTTGDTFVKVLNDVGGHFKVVQLIDTGGTEIFARNSMHDPLKNSLELYFRTSDAAKGGSVILIGDTTPDELFHVLFDTDGKIYAVHNGGNTELQVYSANTWYHLSIRYRSTIGGAYQGLAAGDAKVYIDGTEYGDYTMTAAMNVSRFGIYSNAVPANYKVYFDAVAEDGYGGYSIDDNLDIKPETDITADVRRCIITYPKEGYPTAVMEIESDAQVTVGTTIQVKDNYTSTGATNDNTQIFLGEVVQELGNYPPSYLLKASSKEMDRVREYTSPTYTKDTDGLIAQIISDGDVKFITNGALTDGADLATISLEGDKTFRRILDSCARIDGYTWYLHPDDSLYYNTGAVDTGVNVDGSDVTAKVVNSDDLDEHITRVEIRGGLKADGTQASGSADDLVAQGIYGVIIFRDTDATLNTDALCNTKAAAVLAKVEFPPKKIIVQYLDPTKGFLQPGENISLEWDEEVLDKIELGQFIIDKNVYNAITGFSMLTVSSGLIFNEKKDLLIIQENSQMIQQNASTFTEQHYRQLPYYIHPKNGYTTGTANVYWTATYMYFGKTSLTAGSYCYMATHLPSDYVDGTDILLDLDLRHNGAGEEDIDYNIVSKYGREGIATTTIANTSATFEDVTGDQITQQTLIIDGTDVLNGDVITLRLALEDQDQVDYVRLFALAIRVTVNARV